MTRFDVTPFLSQTEGQHFDRKSLWHGEPGSKRPRERKDVRDEIAEYVAAFANADGGTLVLGLENDGSVTGHGYPQDAIAQMLAVPTSRLQPAGEPGFTVVHDEKQLLVFEVRAADAPVIVTGNGYPLRMGDAVVAAEEPHIRALKAQGLLAVA